MLLKYDELDKDFTRRFKDYSASDKDANLSILRHQFAEHVYNYYKQVTYLNM